MKNFVGRNLTLINLAVAVCCLASYTVTMYSLAYWTHWSDSAGAYGGVLDYRFLGVSTIFHVTGQDLLGQALFAFPDFTSYLLIALMILNLYVLRANWEAYPEIPPRGLAGASIAMGLICILAYAWGTMMDIADLLKPSHNSPGGVFIYSFPVGGSVFHVTSGSLESMGVGWSFDFTVWVLFVIIMLNLVTTASVRWSKRQD